MKIKNATAWDRRQIFITPAIGLLNMSGSGPLRGWALAFAWLRFRVGIEFWKVRRNAGKNQIQS